MEYEKVLVDMLSRICTLEEQVKALLVANEVSIKKIGTAEVKDYIVTLKNEARARGESYIDITANEIHKALQLKSSMPIVCNAMKQVKLEKDEIIHQTPSGLSSTFAIRYHLN